MEEMPNEEQLKLIFESMLRQVLPSRLITNFVIIAEVANEDGSELAVTISDGLTPWAADGMLRYAQQIVTTDDFESFKDIQ
jgi:hypothetical protein